MPYLYPKDYDVIVVGGGHAGCEAALSTARLGLKTLLLTMSLDTIGTMPCNPSIGGPAKGHLTREIDALGGEQAQNIDRTHIHIRKLNTSKGPAVQALRAQAEKKLYRETLKIAVERVSNLDLKQTEVTEVAVKGNCVEGVMTKLGTVYSGKAVILTTGTFMEGLTHLGERQAAAGRGGEPPSHGLSQSLASLGIQMARFKTGTPPRVDKKSVDFNQTTPQLPDDPPPHFSFFPPRRFTEKQVPCHLTQTTEKTHAIIRKNIHLSAMYSGQIEGIGPRYCPSIEDKVMRFPDRSSHPVFLEPEGLDTAEVYVQGLSTSLPLEVQVAYIQTLPGLQKAEIMRPGYAVEYDCIKPYQLCPTLESRRIKGLFFAGQINGTSGYEEAAAQGLLSGLNAACLILGKEPIVLERSKAYLGVLVDDLITKNPTEPYRMFTARSEYRLLLRQDNADLRLTPLGYSVGLIDEARFRCFKRKYDLVDREIKSLRETVLTPTAEVIKKLKSLNSAPIAKAQSLADLLRRPQLTLSLLCQAFGLESDLPSDVQEAVEVSVKYEGYISQQTELLKKMQAMENVLIPNEFDFNAVSGLRTEAREKLKQIRPRSVGQAKRIPGVNPADVTLLMLCLKSKEKEVVNKG